MRSTRAKNNNDNINNIQYIVIPGIRGLVDVSGRCRQSIKAYWLGRIWWKVLSVSITVLAIC